MATKPQQNGKLPREVFFMLPLRTGRFSFRKAHALPESGEVLVRISRSEAEENPRSGNKLVEKRKRDAALHPAGFFEVENPVCGDEFFLRMAVGDAGTFLQQARPATFGEWLKLKPV